MKKCLPNYFGNHFAVEGTIGIQSDPRQGPEPPFSGKEGFGVQKLPFPLVLEREFSVKKIPVLLQGNT